MKKILMAILSLALMLLMVNTVYAAEATLSVSDVEAVPGDVVYLTVKLTESIQGDSVAIQYSFDADVLEPLTDLHTWIQDGDIQGFELDHAGVWASKDAVDLKGDVCILAFRVREEATLSETQVQCILSVRLNGADVGKYTAEASVYKACKHTYGAWKNHTRLEHTRVCTQCGNMQTKSHKWDNGVVSEVSGSPYKQIITYTCDVCGETYTKEITTDQVPLPPTIDTSTSSPNTDSNTTSPDTTPTPEEDSSHEVTPPDWDAYYDSKEQGATPPPYTEESNTSGIQGGSENPYQHEHSGTSENAGSANNAHTQEQDSNSSAGESGEINAYDTPVAIPGLKGPENEESEDSAESTHDHDHDHDSDYDTDTGTESTHTHTTGLNTDPNHRALMAVILFSIIAVAVGGAIVYIKKK